MDLTTLEWTRALVMRIHGAGDGIRTRDIDLGKVALYQLSYSRSTWRKHHCHPLRETLSNKVLSHSFHSVYISAL